MAPSVFAGRALSTVTEYEYRDGVLVRSTATQEAAWTDNDRALAEALDLYEAGLCQGCGQPKARAWHPDHMGWIEINTELTCEGCRALGEWQKSDHEPGVIPRLKDTRPESKPLPPWPQELFD